MRLSFSPFADKPLEELIKLTKIADTEGYSATWITDISPAPPHRDIFVTLASLACNTKRIGLGTCVCNPYTRHPAIIANAMNSIQELSKGRATLGIGAGSYTALTPIGIEPWDRPLVTMREAIRIIRKLFSGEEAHFSGEVFKVNKLTLRMAPYRSIPIYVACRGQHMLELAGELANGVFLNASLSYLPFASFHITKGATRAGIESPEIIVANRIPFAVTSSKARALELVRASVATLISQMPPQMVLESKIDLELAKEIKRDILELRPDMASRHVTSALADSLSIAGTPQDCIKRIREYEQSGVREILVREPFGEDPASSLETIAREVLPFFRSGHSREF